jgi:rhodanese-related sulfurtransferase
MSIFLKGASVAKTPVGKEPQKSAGKTVKDHPFPSRSKSDRVLDPGVCRGALWGVILGFLALGGCLSGPSVANRPALLTASEVREKLDHKENVALVFACPGAAESKPRIPGSVLAREFLSTSATLPRDLDIILYCGCAGDEAAHQLVPRLRAEGFTSIHVLSGGILAWIRAGYPLTAGGTLGRDFGGEIEVSAGLKGNERRVANPTGSLRDGQAVQVEVSAALAKKSGN